jgi:hypothetical protein
MGWPANMVEKSLADGSPSYYWNIHVRYARAGCPVHRQALGSDYAAATERAKMLNAQLDAWRCGRGAVKDIDLQPGFGTLEWLIERYKRSPAYEKKVSKRSCGEYERTLELVLRHPLKNGTELGAADLTAISAHAVDKLYEQLQKGKRVKRRLRQANLCIIRTARAWDVVQRLFPKAVPAENPFRGVALEHGRGTTKPATRAEAYALHVALVAAGDPHLAAVPLISFEWHQRPENVLAGHLTWADYRPSDRPNTVRVLHHKTGELVSLALSDRDGPLFPELTAYLDRLERLGVPIVLMKPKRGDKNRAKPAKPYLLRTARNRVRAAARAAKLPDHLTLAACRHGGLTELGDAELTEQGVMALSGHRTPEAARLYVKRTDTQRASAARKRRAWVEVARLQIEASEIEAPSREQGNE